MSGEFCVLVADDERGIADLYTTYLGEEYEVRTAYDGAEAIEALDESVDVLVLDRNMPEYSARDVLRRVDERGLECLVAIVTGFEPDSDILEEGFDDYLVKPVSADELRETVAQLVTRLEYKAELREYFALLSQRAVIEQAERGGGEGIDDEVRDEIAAELETREVEAAGHVESLSEDEIQTMFRAGFVSDDFELPERLVRDD